MPNSRRGGRGDSEAGGALAFVMLIMAALLFVAAYSMNVSLSGRRSSVRRMQGKAAFFCAETGLELGRVTVAANRSDWNTVLGGAAAGWYPVVGACPGPGGYTYRVTIRDNIDEDPSSATNDWKVDIDQKVIVESEALRGGVAVARVSALVEAVGSADFGDYGHQFRLGSRKEGNN